ncbi:MAG TPA: hypothetical protein IAC31_06585 [Candidatus Faecousia intestinigallinarum]|nr:hypothetical protein [Candidatus Faecousia intestinigallinarum]
MQSVKSYFNKGVVRKDILRFSPVWGFYSLMLAMMLLIPALNQQNIPWILARAINFLAPINLVYGLVCALALFGDLYRPRHCNALHAMPLRREGWFFSHVTSGLLFSLVPSLIFCAIAACTGDGGVYVAGWWLLASTLSFLCFFGMAVFCALCAGNALAAVMLYGMLNVLAGLLSLMLEGMLSPLLPGVVLDIDFLYYLIPLLTMSAAQYLGYESSINGYLLVLKDGWGYLAVCALVGLALLGLALLFYRKRKLERAGDFLAVGWLRPVFLVVFSLFAGTLGFLVQILFFREDTVASWVLFAVGLAAGFFLGKMFLHHRVQVFQRRSWVQLAALGAVVAACLLAVYFDPMGIVTYIPPVEEVRSVYLEVGYGDGDAAVVTNPSDITIVEALHEEILPSAREKQTANTFRVKLTYDLGSRTVQRSYYLPERHYGSQSQFLKQLQGVLTRNGQLFQGGYTQKEALERLDSLRINNTDIPQKLLPGLLLAMEADLQEGTLLQNRMFHDDNCGCSYTMEWIFDREDVDGKSYSTYYYRQIFECCTNTIAWIQAHPELHISSY